MAALAKILSQMGHIVRGVDVEEDFYTLNHSYPIQLENFSNMNLKKSYYYIIGNAYTRHSVTKYIQNMKYQYMIYPQFLNWYFKEKKWISVAATSGKTTTNGRLKIH